MHICLATHEFPPLLAGGISTYYASLAGLLAQAGHEVTVLTTAGSSDDTGEWVGEGVRMVQLDQARKKRLQQIAHLIPSESRSTANAAAIGLSMRDWLLENATADGIDVVETIDYLGYSAFLIDQDLPAVLLTCHGSQGQVFSNSGFDLRTPEYGTTSSLEAIGIALADEIGCYSPLNSKDWECFTGRTPRFMRAPFRVSQVEERSYVESETFTGIVIARLNNWKGIFELVDALAMCNARGVDVQIRWVGRDQPAPEEGIDSVRDYLRAERSDVWGKLLVWEESMTPDQVRAAQLEADFALVPSRWDTFNFTVIEAMSAGAPLIVSTGAGASYLCEDGKDALVVPPRDPKALAGAIARMRDPELREQLGRAGRSTVENEFSAEAVLRERLDGYASAIERHRYRRCRGYVPSVMTPLVWKWFRSEEVLSPSSLAARLPARLILSEAVRRLGRKLNPIKRAGRD